MSSSATSSPSHAKEASQDARATVQLRKDLAGSPTPISFQGDITGIGINHQMADASRRQFLVYRSLVASGDLWRERTLTEFRPRVGRPEMIRVYFTAKGDVPGYPSITIDGQEAILVPWAHPLLGKIRGQSFETIAKETAGDWQPVSHAVIDRESAGRLSGWRGVDRSGDFTMAEVAPDGSVFIESKSIDALAQATEEADKGVFGLKSKADFADGVRRELVFAMDERQKEPLFAYAGDGTIVIMGAPGTGKTTLACMRGRVLLQSLIEKDGLLREGKPQLVKERFAFFVVTDHLRDYLSGFLASDDLGLKGAEVHNLRGAWLESFWRDKVLISWLGRRPRLSEPVRGNDELRYLKAHPTVLNLAFLHAHAIAEENGSRGFDDFITTVSEALVRGDAGAGQREAVAHLKQALPSWLTRFGKAVESSIGTARNAWLAPGADDLLFSEILAGIRYPFGANGNRVEDIVWRHLRRMMDPQEILLRVIADLRSKGDRKDLLLEGMTVEALDQALDEWHATLTGHDAETEAAPPETDEWGTTIAAQRAIDPVLDDDGMPVRRGSFARSDLPILACLARAFLLCKAGISGKPGSRVGIALPDGFGRYDHVIVDEAQDLTYPEIHLVQSLVEPQLRAVTISGDPYQRMDWRSGFHSLEAVDPGDRGRIFRIDRNYRQTRQLQSWVAELSQRLYPGERVPIEPGNQDGPHPRIEAAPKLGDAVVRTDAIIRGWFDARRNPFVAVLMVGFQAGTITTFVEKLAKSLDTAGISVAHPKDGRLIERGQVAVAEVSTVKGLEFDGVIVVLSESAANELDSADPRLRPTKNKLYVATTRPCRDLVILTQGKIPIILPPTPG